MASYQIFIAHFSLSVIFFYIINWIGRHSVSLGYIQLSVFVKDDEAPAFNFILRTFSPTVYIIILSTFFYGFGFDILVKNIWLIAVYYVLFRTSFNIIMDRARLINWGMQFAQWIISIPLAYFAYTKIISNKINLLPDFTTVSNELWVIIFLYLYSVMNNIQTSKEGTRKRKSNYLKLECTKYKKIYSEIISSKSANEEIKTLVYAILIYENFARPKAMRLIENSVPKGFEITRGIMQVRTKERINDLESIKLAIEKINSDYELSMHEAEEHAEKNWPENFRKELGDEMIKRDALRITVAKYNKDIDYINEVLELHRIIPDMLKVV